MMLKAILSLHKLPLKQLRLVSHTREYRRYSLTCELGLFIITLYPFSCEYEKYDNSYLITGYTQDFYYIIAKVDKKPDISTAGEIIDLINSFEGPKGLFTRYLDLYILGDNIVSITNVILDSDCEEFTRKNNLEVVKNLEYKLIGVELK